MTQSPSWVCFLRTSFGHPELGSRLLPEIPEWLFRLGKQGTFCRWMRMLTSNLHGGVRLGTVIRHAQTDHRHQGLGHKHTVHEWARIFGFGNTALDSEYNRHTCSWVRGLRMSRRFFSVGKVPHLVRRLVGMLLKQNNRQRHNGLPRPTCRPWNQY
jgi:hypothetical protein